MTTGRAEAWTEWVEWVRTTLTSQEGAELLSTLTTEQEEHLAKEEYVWLRGIGVLWKAPDQMLHRARFTHGTYFDTTHGEFHIDSEGNTRRLPVTRAAQVPGLEMDATNRARTA